MDDIPKRHAVTTFYRNFLSSIEFRLPLPNLEPNFYSFLGIFFSALILFTKDNWHKLILLALILMFDWLDGTTARRFNKANRSGYIIDLISDRISEVFIILTTIGISLGQIFFFLWILNLIFSYSSLKSNKHVSIPLRCVLAIYFLIEGARIP